MNRNTAATFRAACAQVLSVLDNWEAVDVRELDADEVFARFQNLRGKEFKPRSLNDYRGRFKQALKSYVSYVGDPAAWRPHAQTRDDSNGSRRIAQTLSSARRSKRASSVGSPVAETQPSNEHEGQAIRSNGESPHYRFGLLNGVTVELRASGRLTPADFDLLRQYLELLKQAAEAS